MATYNLDASQDIPTPSLLPPLITIAVNIRQRPSTLERAVRRNPWSLERELEPSASGKCKSKRIFGRSFVTIDLYHAHVCVVCSGCW